MEIQENGSDRVQHADQRHTALSAKPPNLSLSTFVGQAQHGPSKIITHTTEWLPPKH